MKIVFAHNVYDRLATLKETISIEIKFFPDSNISIASNNVLIENFQEFSRISTVMFKEKPHKIGCVNGCILSIKELLDLDFDVLIFSHDDVRINEKYLDVVKKHINSIKLGEYDIICRMPNEFGNNYYMMEIFYMSKKAAVQIFKNIVPIKSETEIQLDLHHRISPEVWFYNIISNIGLKINEINFQLKINSIEESIKYEYNLVLGQNLGYYHLNAGKRAWKENKI